MNQRMTIGMLLAFLSYRSQFSSRGAALIDNLLQYRLAGVHLDRLGDITQTEPEVRQDTIPVAYRELMGHLLVEDVVFRYAPALPAVINQLSFQITAGESVALVAPSGFGKTTLVKLLLGLLQPETGRICIDQVELPTFGLERYRRQVGVVMQDDCLFACSLLDNVALFEPQPNVHWVKTVCQMACIHDDILAAPMGYHSLVGDMGAALSGGQLQRLLLARALYRRPRILFLDEATSHLDGTIANAIENNLAQLDITRVIISHRQATRRVVDRVIDLSNTVEVT